MPDDGRRARETHGLVVTRPDAGSLPACVEPSEPGIDLCSAGETNRQGLQDLGHEVGAVLFRGFRVDSVEQFSRFSALFIHDYMDCTTTLTPREAVTDTISTATLAPAEVSLEMHSEFSVLCDWPRTIAFYCDVAPTAGGETPIADTRGLLARLRPETRDRFVDLGILYVRHVNTADAESQLSSWQQNGTEWEVEVASDTHIRATRRTPAVREHPVTGERVWFNHLLSYHLQSFPAAFVRTRFGLVNGASPREAYYGDGSTISRETIREIRAAYAAQTATFSWRRGDILLLDNMLIAHGRRPFEGSRRILVAMGNSYRAYCARSQRSVDSESDGGKPKRKAGSHG
jgi:alpha-ketoglutarate-dependent taurine dioxygenase